MPLSSLATTATPPRHATRPTRAIAAERAAVGHEPTRADRPAVASALDAIDAIAAIAREFAGLHDDVDHALERLADGAQTLLAADGACVVLLDGSLDDAPMTDARIAAGAGSLAALRGQRTELLDPPSPLHQALVERRVVVSTIDLGRRGRRRSVVVAPLLVPDDAVAAALCVVTDRPDGFSADDAALADRLAVHGALALRDYRRYRAAERNARDARVLADVAQTLARHVAPESLHAVLAGLVRESLGAIGFAITLADPVTGHVERLHADGGLPAETFWESIAGRVVRDAQPSFADGRLAVLPLVAGETRGVLSIHFPARHAFDAAERRLLVDFAAQVAVALRNASLFAARERERDRAVAAAEIARLGFDATTLDLGVAAILGVLDRLVPSNGKTLSVLRDPAGTPRYVATTGATAESAIVIPLVARGRALGDVAVTMPLDRPLGGAGRDALCQLADPVALAIDAMLLGDERRRRLGEERQMAEQLRQAEKMAALGELVAGVAHEINNPLTGVSVFAELLLDDALTDEQHESVRLIKREADRAVNVVRDLLAFSRKTEPSYEELDLNDLLERTLRLRAYALRTEGIDVRLSLDPRLPVVMGDASKLQQVVLNLLLNAEHAMRESSIRQLDATTRVVGDRVVLSVADTGIGIAPDVRPRVFEPFFTTKPAGEGTGLGLSVSYGIVQAHGGELRVDSVLGAGTTLAVLLPIPPSSATP